MMLLFTGYQCFCWYLGFSIIISASVFFVKLSMFAIVYLFLIKPVYFFFVRKLYATQGRTPLAHIWEQQQRDQFVGMFFGITFNVYFVTGIVVLSMYSYYTYDWIFYS
jgi:hypothetical protein